LVHDHAQIEAKSAMSGAGKLVFLRGEPHGQSTLDDWIARVQQGQVVQVPMPPADVIAQASESPIDLEIRGEAASKPLWGKRVVLLRPAAQIEAAARSLRRQGAIVRACPVVQLVPSEDSKFAPAFAALGDYDWLIFSSQNAVSIFFVALFRSGRDARSIARSKLAAIGTKTAEALREFGLVADSIAPEFRGESLAESIIKSANRPLHILFPRAKIAREALPQCLRAAGHRVDILVAYESKSASPAMQLKLIESLEDADAILFSANSLVEEFANSVAQKVAKVPQKIVFASIGPITSEALRARGNPVHLEASPYTMDSLVSALCAYFEATPR
jgi:uroporphyrinogen III methyltransferase/synthase